MIKFSTFILSAIMLFSSQAMAVKANLYQTAESVVNSFENKFGVTKGKRRNHTKGICFKAELVPANREITQYSISPIFSSISSVIGRLSHKGGNNHAPDNKPAEYGMGLLITTRSDDMHIMAMNTLDFFPVATAEAFAELMSAKVAGKQAVKTFKEGNKDLQRFSAHMATKDKILIPYEGATYNSINSFYLVNKEGKKQAVRWAFVPDKNQKIVMAPNADFFLDNMQTNLDNHGISWDMVVSFAKAGDHINNPALPWRGERKQIIAAKLKVKSISTEQDGECDNINYDPLLLSTGFEASEDRILEMRRLSYAISFSRRMSEK